MAGRKSKYTSETVEKITQAIRLGATYELAASYAGIDHSTFFRWMNDKSDFRDAVKAAEGAGAMQWLAKIEKAASDGNWQAAAWKLERRYPERYGRTVVDNRNYDLSKLSDDDLAKLARGEKP
jgi:transposase